MPKLTSVDKSISALASFKIVLVTLDNHLASACKQVAKTLAENSPIQFKSHAASDWRNNDDLLATCKHDIEQADIVIVTMLFMEDQFLPVLETLQNKRQSCDAMVCVMSAPQVMQLTRMGKYEANAQKGGLIGILKKLRPAAKDSSGKDTPASAGAKQMAMLRRLPKLLRFIPGSAQDIRIFFLVMQYWLAGSERNIYSMVVMLIQRYSKNAPKQIAQLSAPDEPVEYPEVGVYHPQMKGRLSSKLSDLPSNKSKQPVVGLLLLRSYLIAGNTLHYDAVIYALEAKGLRVIPAFSSGLDARCAINQFFKQGEKPLIEAMVSLTGFSLVGGPAYNDAKAAQEALKQLDVPYIAAHPVEFQSLDQWGGSDRGLLPVESTIMVAIPELDGSTVPMVYGGRPGPEGTSCTGCERNCTFTKEHKVQDMFTCAERTDMLASRVNKLVRLRQKERQDRKLAIVIFNFPPSAGSVGTAAYLSVFESLYNTLENLSTQGYKVDMPNSIDALRDQILIGNAATYGTQANVHTKIPAKQHIQNEKWLHAIEAEWGPAPGKQLSNGQNIFILGAQFGEILIALQPGFGYEGDPMRLLFEKGFAPTHAFSAFYRYLREEYKADAVLHFGTHGALEFMPGKQTGLSGRCWPERLIDDLPNVYLYAANNPSEGAIAKRRAAATLVSYLTPTISEAGLYKGLIELKQSIERWMGNDVSEASERLALLQIIREQALALDLDAPELDKNNIQKTIEQNSKWVEQLKAQLLEMEYSLIPEGLHVVGRIPNRQDKLSTLKSMASAMDLPSDNLMEPLVDGASIESLQKINSELTETQVTSLQHLVRSNQMLNNEYELNGLIRALDARYIEPAPGGDILRNPDVLPTGRNLHGLDPFKLPTAFAVKDAKRQADKLLARFAADGQGLPESVAIVLWGSDNLKSEGGPMSQALALMGALPRFDTYGRLAGATLVPLSELGRPRIDVVITLSGIFRDLMPMQIKLLAEASFLAASADEPEDQNFIRKHSLEFMKTQNCDIETASLRVFGNSEGAYGSNVNLLIDSSAWEQENELGSAFTSRKGFAYGRGGQPVRNNALLQSALANVSLTYQNLDSVELGVTSIDTYFDTLGGISRAVLQAKHKRDGNQASAPPVYIGDQTQGDGVVRSLTEQVALETRTRMLNPKWHESMLQHGYEGVRQIEVHLTNTMGWSATTGQVQPWVYQQLAQTFILDPEMRERLANLNPTASAKVAGRLLEASRRQYWKPDQETMKALQQAGDELEDRLEGIQEGVLV